MNTLFELGLVVVAWVSFSWSFRSWKRIDSGAIHYLLISLFLGAGTWVTWIERRGFEVLESLSVTGLLMVACWGLFPWIDKNQFLIRYKIVRTVIMFVLIGVGTWYLFT